MKIQELFERPRTRIIVISIAVFLLLAGTIVAIACFNMKSDNDGYIDDDYDDDDEYIGAFADQTTKPTQTTAPSTEEYTGIFLFESNGDGTCSIIGVTDKSIEEIVIPDESPSGDIVVEIGERAFKGCSKLESVEISGSVEKIGERAFSGCTSLASFSVDSSNTKYASSGGVLFFKNKSELVCYPISRVGKSYILPMSVKIIGAYAFEDVTYLQKILYEGSSAKYKSIEVCEGNDTFLGLAITYNYSGAK